jgi:8-oxo-dGTP pyrophosphatase MutT (NUDIX family)
VPFIERIASNLADAEPTELAARELREETGVVADAQSISAYGLFLLGPMNSATGSGQN